MIAAAGEAGVIGRESGGKGEFAPEAVDDLGWRYNGAGPPVLLRGLCGDHGPGGRRRGAGRKGGY